MRRFRRNPVPPTAPDGADARELVDLAARMGIPPEDAARQVSQLINEANHSDRDFARIPVAPRT